ncbi:META domain-containing protein [Streptomyces aureus]|uniref:META domain-containing protein n=1 Tax=Streptomyces aureus TaxID=193461 RepID=UPI000689A465
MDICPHIGTNGRRTALGALALLLLTSACATRSEGATPAPEDPAAQGAQAGAHRDAPLLGTKWTVTALGDTDGGARPLPEGAKAYLVLREDGTFQGRLGCNHASAEATVSDGHITLSRARTTRMMCQDSLMRTEKTLLGLFGGTVAYRIDHRDIALTSANGTVVRAVADE